MINKTDYYLGNQKLKRVNVPQNYTPDQVSEFLKCMRDPIYFIKNYVKIINVDRGIIDFDLYDFQEDMLNVMVNNRYSIHKLPRQSGKCAYIDTTITVKNEISGEIYETTLGKFFSQIKLKNEHEEGNEEKIRSQILNSTGVQRLRTMQNMRVTGIQQQQQKIYSTNYDRLSTVVERKFVDSLDISNFGILTDTGFEKISSIHKTIPYQEWQINTKSKSLICADDHIVFLYNGQEIFVKDLRVGDYIITDSGVEPVLRVTQTSRESNMFDVTVDSCNQRYYTNGILSHNTSSVVALMLWYTLFHSNYSIAILANRKEQSQEILSRYQLAYENLPKWIQQGVVEWNKRSIELENGCKIAADATTGSAARGTSRNMIYLDEFAFVDNNLQDEFFASAFPVVSSGKTTKVIMTSTPSGLNKFYKLWSDSEKGKSEFAPFSVEWNDVPGRDEEWKRKQIAIMGEEKFRQEFSTEFIGSSNTLIAPNVLLNLVKEDPLYSTPQIAVHEEPVKGKPYVIICDVARGVEGDYSAFTVIDISTIPYRIVAKFKDNKISPMLFPDFIHQFAKKYNDAYVLVEINDAGQQVADILHYELEYDNMIHAAMKGRKGQQVGGGFGGSNNLGVRTTKQVKRIGCQNLKTLVEAQQLILNDIDVIEELYSFVQVGDSYKAEEGQHDDLVMTLVLFGWLTMQDYFKELSDLNIRNAVALRDLGKTEEEYYPSGIFSSFDDDTNAPEGVMSVSEFEKWLDE